jgi:hypothetical protein
MLETFQMKTKKASLPEKDFLDRVVLIRSIQRAEGNPDCYRSGQVDCDQLDCVWRKYCLEKPREHQSKRHKHKRGN